MHITENADGSVSVKSGFDEYDNSPEYVTQYHTNVDELTPEHIQANSVIERRNANLTAHKAKVVAVVARVQQVEQAKKEHQSWLKQYWEDVREAAHSNSMFGSLVHEESGFDISEAYISPINELSGNMALSRAQSDNLGSSFYLESGKEDYGMKVVEPDNYQRKITDVQDEFGYTLVNGETLDRASLANAKAKIAKDKAKTALVKNQHAKAFANTVLHADKGPKLTTNKTSKGLGSAPSIWESLANALKATPKVVKKAKVLPAKYSEDELKRRRKNQGHRHAMNGLGAASNSQLQIKMCRVLVKAKKLKEKALSLAEDNDYKFVLLDKAQELSDKIEDIAMRKFGLVAAAALFSNYGMRLRNSVTTSEIEAQA